MIDLAAYIARFQANAATIENLISGISADQARWKPSSEQWSILEVINHLYDEERQDFRVRLDYILHKPESEWPPIDPQGWVTERRYNERVLQPSLRNFLSEREDSLAWLGELEEQDWSVHSRLPDYPPMSAGSMLASWLAHDFLHIRQLSELHWQYVTHQAQPFSTEYAGDF